MFKKIIIPLVCIIIAFAVVALINIRPDEKPSAQPIKESETTAVMPAKNASKYTYEVKLDGETVCLYTLDESGKNIDKKSINSINIYSLYPSQLDLLVSGRRFDSREQAAEFIQDLGS